MWLHVRVASVLGMWPLSYYASGMRAWLAAMRGGERERKGRGEEVLAPRKVASKATKQTGPRARRPRRRPVLSSRFPILYTSEEREKGPEDGCPGSWGSETR